MNHSTRGMSIYAKTPCDIFIMSKDRFSGLPSSCHEFIRDFATYQYHGTPAIKVAITRKWGL